MSAADFEPARPLPTDNGIAPPGGDDEPGATWWSRRFIELLESFGVGSRPERGRGYARGGQVTELEVANPRHGCEPQRRAVPAA